jgi:hypothetical protein
VGLGGKEIVSLSVQEGSREMRIGRRCVSGGDVRHPVPGSDILRIWSIQLGNACDRGLCDVERVFMHVMI